MQKLLTAIAAFAITLGLATIALAQQHITPLVRISDEAQGLQPIRLGDIDMTIDVAGSLARTTLLLTLDNPNARQLEGTLEFPLTAGQQVTGFALDIDGAMRDAVPVPKEKGRAVFEAIERRNVDPGLVEQVAGNHFRVRVYPIPAHGTRQVRLTIDETLSGSAMQLPVDLLSEAAGVHLRVSVEGAGKPRIEGAFDNLAFRERRGVWQADVKRSQIRRGVPLTLKVGAKARQAAYVAQRQDGERYVLAETFVRADVRDRALSNRVGLLWDASASARKRDRDAEFRILDRYFGTMGEGTVTLRFLRDTGEDGGKFTIRDGGWSALRTKLESAVYDGATDLADWTPDANVDEYLLFTDGLANYGDKAFPRLGDKQRLYAVAPTSGADLVRLRASTMRRNGAVAHSVDALLQEPTRIVALVPHGVTDLEVPSRFLENGWLRIAGRATQAKAFVDVTLDDGTGRRVVRVDMPSDGESHPQVASLWAGWKVAALSADPERNAANIARIGQQFGVVTAGTSLLVLEDPWDYVQYDIPAPAVLRAEVDALRATDVQEKKQGRSARLDQVAAMFGQRIEWWNRKFPKTAPPMQQIAKEADMARATAAAVEEREMAQRSSAEEPPVVFDEPSPGAPPPAPPAPAAAPASAALESVAVVGNASGEPTATIALQPWQPDAPYARRMRDAKSADVYALYLDERDTHVDSTAFLLDSADILFAKGRRTEALRVLSNLAEMQLESRHVLRVLGYRLMQAGDHARAVEVFRKVLAMSDEEPQSHRDLGLALAAAGQRQEAIERLYEVVAGQWDGRFAEIELVALNELNAIVARSPSPLDTAFVDRRLLRNLPLDLRAALAWDSDNSDMDLWVTDPNGEKCYYGNKDTYQGGHVSDDFTGGYGPEEFLLRDAKPGKYRVEAQYFGDRQQVVTGATTLTLTLSTGWGTGKQVDKTVTLRLEGAKESVLVGEFEVR